MIIKENLTINGRDFVKTYSDAGMMIERDSVQYSEAIDPIGFDRQYIETNKPIEQEENEDIAEVKQV